MGSFHVGAVAPSLAPTSPDSPNPMPQLIPSMRKAIISGNSLPLHVLRGRRNGAHVEVGKSTVEHSPRVGDADKLEGKKSPREAWKCRTETHTLAAPEKLPMHTGREGEKQLEDGVTS